MGKWYNDKNLIVSIYLLFIAVSSAGCESNCNYVSSSGLDHDVGRNGVSFGGSDGEWQLIADFMSTLLPVKTLQIDLVLLPTSSHYHCDIMPMIRIVLGPFMEAVMLFVNELKERWCTVGCSSCSLACTVFHVQAHRSGAAVSNAFSWSPD